ncbi:MAG TPA: branched-chain amino acid ABC transporter permease [Burkholderiaceae bacterium]|nr:branched-chain amino acid ABC transporter permease [Burkholderiaceae bacterium]
MLQILVDTLLRTSDLALVALGLSMVYGLARFPNIAHVQYAMMGAFIAYLFSWLGLPLLLAVLLAALVTGLFTLVVHHFIFRRLLRSGPAITMIGSLALSMLIVAVALALAGSYPKIFPRERSAPIFLGDAILSWGQVTTMATTASIIVLFLLLLFYTRVGRAMRALSSNRDLAYASGLNADRITSLVDFSSGALAGLGGSMLALSIGAHINLGHDLLLPTFAAAILGGLGNPIGAIGGALLIAFAETLVTNINFGFLFDKPLVFMPASYINAASFFILLVALIFRPYGLFDREVRRV